MDIAANSSISDCSLPHKEKEIMPWQPYSRVYDLMDYMPFVQQLRQMHLSALSGLENILDNGCGTGPIVQQLKIKCTNKVVGVDFSPDMLAKAAERLYGISKAVLLRADSHNLPFHDSSFDGVVSNMVLYLVENPQIVLDEIARVAKPNGILTLASPKKGLDVQVLIEMTQRQFELVNSTSRLYGLPEIPADAIEAFIKSNRDIEKRVRNLYDIAEISKLIEQRGFHIISQRDDIYEGQCFFLAASKKRGPK